MQALRAALIFLTFALVHGWPDDALSETPIAFQQIKLKDETVLKMVRPKEHPEYPGNNIKHLKKINDDWNNYYECLNNQLEQENERKPTVVQIMEGQSTIMKCPHCRRPFEGVANLEWKYKPLSSDINDPGELQILDLAPQMLITHKMSLRIFNAFRGYSGLYVCYHGNYSVAAYILEVVIDQPMTLLNEEPSANDMIELRDDICLEVYYLWSRWTECSACNFIGKKYRYGICMAKLERCSHLSTRRAPPGVLSGRRLKKSKVHPRKSKKRQESDVTPQTEAEETKAANYLMNKFKTGIPCTSYIMPDLYATLIRNLNKTPSAAMLKYCKVECPESTIFKLMDRNGKILEVANNSAGIYSSLQDIPKTPPEVKRKTVKAEFGEDIILQCPGNMNEDIPVSWMVNLQMLIPEIISNESFGRVFIDLLNRLHIKRVRLKDDTVYSCWQRNTLVGTVSLDIDKKLNFSFDHHMMLLSMVAILITCFYIGSKILVRELKMRRRRLTT